MLFDIHAHLTSKEFSNVDEIINDCKKNNISIINNGLDYIDNEKVLELSKKYSNVYASLGMHPTNKFDNKVINQIRVNEKNIVAIGEVGLDFREGFKSTQITTFKKFIDLAIELNKPLIIHSRKAEKEVIELTNNLDIPVIYHCFSGKKKLLANTTNYFSIPSNVTYSEQFKIIVNEIPIERLFCETDSPYLSKSFPNTPLNVKNSYAEIAKIKGLKLSTVISKIGLNVKETMKIIGFKNN